MSSAIREINLRARFIIGPLLGALALVYFGYHVVQGDRGLITWVQRAQQVEQAQGDIAKLKIEHKKLAHRTTLLRPESLDLDLLEERARLVLNLVRHDEVVIFDR